MKNPITISSMLALPAPAKARTIAELVTESTRKAIYIPQAQRDAAVAILNRAMPRKGQFVGFLWVRPLKTLKTTVSAITKEVRMVARVGVDYENLASTLDGRESGDLPASNQGLPWGQWLHFPYLIQHKGNLYLRLYPVAGHKARTTYRLNGQIAREEEVRPLCLASEFASRDDTTCLTLNLDHLRRFR